MMSPNWSFKALVEPTARKYRVVFAGGKKQMTFLTEDAAAWLKFWPCEMKNPLSRLRFLSLTGQSTATSQRRGRSRKRLRGE